MKKFITAALLLAAAASPLMAQEQIEKLYQRMASDPKVQVKQSIQVDRKPGTEVQGKTSVCEINDFTIAKKNKKGRYVEHLKDYVSDIAAAIQAEAANPQCYRIASYNAESPAQPRQWNLLYGDDASQYVEIGKYRGRNYIFACLTDKQNPDYRWCYALEWFEMDKYMQGCYMRLYAKIPEKTTSEPQYQGTVKYNAADDRFNDFYGLAEGLYGTGLIINPDHTFTLNGKTLPLDSLTSAFIRLEEMDPIQAEIMTGGLVTAVLKNKASRAEHVMQSFNAMRARWANGDYKTDPTLSVSIYTLIKDAIAKDILNDDEKELINKIIVEMVVQSDTDPKYSDFYSYLSLTQKIIERSMNK